VASGLEPHFFAMTALVSAPCEGVRDAEAAERADQLAHPVSGDHLHDEAGGVSCSGPFGWTLGVSLEEQVGLGRQGV